MHSLTLRVSRANHGAAFMPEHLWQCNVVSHVHRALCMSEGETSLVVPMPQPGSISDHLSVCVAWKHVLTLQGSHRGSWQGARELAPALSANISLSPSLYLALSLRKRQHAPIERQPPSQRKALGIGKAVCLCTPEVNE